MKYRELDYDYRLNEAQRMLGKYPDRVPIIIEPTTDDLKLKKCKYLVPKDITCGQFLYVIRKYIKLEPKEALFMFVSNVLPATNDSIANIYNLYKEPDLFLYIKISKENTFGYK
jgi:GABA(A) receptor-associated protein